MSRQKDQIGSAYLIVVILLVIALLGSLGFIAYQNFFQTKKEDNSSKVKDNKGVDKTTTPEVTDNSFKISQWGLSGIMPAGYSIQYEIVGQSAHFKSSDMAGSCSDATLGAIDKFSGTESASGILFDNQDKRTISQLFDSGDFANTLKHIGEYYYLYISPQSACTPEDSSTNDYSDQIKAVQNIKEYFESLK